MNKDDEIELEDIEELPPEPEELELDLSDEEENIEEAYE